MTDKGQVWLIKTNSQKVSQNPGKPNINGLLVVSLCTGSRRYWSHIIGVIKIPLAYIYASHFKSIHLSSQFTCIYYIILLYIWFSGSWRTWGQKDTGTHALLIGDLCTSHGHEDRTGPLLSGNLNGHILSNSNFSFFILSQWSDIFNDFLQQHNLFHDWFLIRFALSVWVTETYSGK